MKIRRFEPDDAPLWDEYVSSHPDGTLFHSARWRAILTREYGFEDYSLLSVNGNQIIGMLPLFKVKSPFGSRLVSLPVSMYGGPLSDDRQTSENIIQRVSEMSFRSGTSLRIRLDWPLEVPNTKSVLTEQDSVIACNGQLQFEQIWRELVSTQARRDSRKSQRLGVTVHHGERAALPVFYELYFAERKRLRLPAASKRHFDRILREFEGGIFWAEAQGIPIATLLYLVDVDCVHYVNAASSLYGRRLLAADLLISTLIEEAARRAVSQLRLGGSADTNTGLRHFKRKWGASESPVYSLTNGNLARRYESSKRRGIWLWNHLPDPLISRAGPIIIRWFA